METTEELKSKLEFIKTMEAKGVKVSKLKDSIKEKLVHLKTDKPILK